MIKIKLYAIGKVKANWIQEGINTFTGRLKPSIQVEWIVAKNEKQLNDYLEEEPIWICLTEDGKQLPSADFSLFIEREFTRMGSKLVFAIGGPNGFDESLKQKASHRISLSAMTFTQELTRLILMEQLYRSFEILKGSPYHKI